MVKSTVLLIRGAFAASDQYWGFEPRNPGFDWRFCDLPPLGSVDQYLQHFDSIASSISGPVLVCGVSLGGVLALGLTAQNIRAVAALDPPLKPHLAWPIRDEFRRRINDQNAPMLADCFGLYPDRTEPRDHGYLLDVGSAPVYALCGAIPLTPERPFEVMPSLVDDESYALLKAHPRTWVRRVVEVGHNIADGGATIIEGLLHDMQTLHVNEPPQTRTPAQEHR